MFQSTLYSHHAHAHVWFLTAEARRAGGKPGIADAAVFNMVRDDRLLHGAVGLDPYPHMAAAVQAFAAIAAVADWITAWEARTD